MPLKNGEIINYFCHGCDIRKKLAFRSEEARLFQHEHMFHNFSMYSDNYGKENGFPVDRRRKE